MLRTVVTIIYIIICVVLSVLVLMQEGKQRGLGVVSGGYWSKAKSRSKEGKMVRWTAILSVLFFVISIVLSMHPHA